MKPAKKEGSNGVKGESVGRKGKVGGGNAIDLRGDRSNRKSNRKHRARKKEGDLSQKKSVEHGNSLAARQGGFQTKRRTATEGKGVCYRKRKRHGKASTKERKTGVVSTVLVEKRRKLIQVSVHTRTVGGKNAKQRGSRARRVFWGKIRGGA